MLMRKTKTSYQGWGQYSFQFRKLARCFLGGFFNLVCCLFIWPHLCGCACAPSVHWARYSSFHTRHIGASHWAVGWDQGTQAEDWPAPRNPFLVLPILHSPLLSCPLCHPSTHHLSLHLFSLAVENLQTHCHCRVLP